MLYPKVVEVARAEAARMKEARPAVTYLVVGVDQGTFAPWHENVRAADVATAREIACARAWARGVALVIAAVVGPGCRVLPEPEPAHATLSHAA
jgi:hypothetical protein